MPSVRKRKSTNAFKAPPRKKKSPNQDDNEINSKIGKEELADENFFQRTRKSSRRSNVSYKEKSDSEEVISSDSPTDPSWKVKNEKRQNSENDTPSSNESDFENEKRTVKANKVLKKKANPKKEWNVESNNNARTWDKLSESSDSSDDEASSSALTIPSKKIVNHIKQVKCVEDVKMEVESFNIQSETLSDGDELAEKKLCARSTVKNEVKEDPNDSVEKRKVKPKKIKDEFTKIATKSKQKVKQPSPAKKKRDDKSQDVTSEESDWEEVAEEKDIDGYNPEIPQDGIDIMLALPKELQRKQKYKKSNAELFRDYCCSLLRKIIKENHFHVHKANLLCCIARSIYVTNICKSSLVKALLISIIPDKILNISVKNCKLDVIQDILKWFHDEFTHSTQNEFGPLETQLECAFKSRKCSSSLLTFIFAAIMWHLKFDCRIVYSYNPIPIKDYVHVENPFRLKNFDENVSHNYMIAFKNKGKKKNSKKLTSHKPPKINKSPEPQEEKEALKAKFDERRRWRYSARKEKSRKLQDVDKKVKKSSTKKKEIEECSEYNDSGTDDSDFEKKPVSKSKSRKSKDEKVKSLAKIGPIDEWLEIYVGSLKRWICIDCVNCLVDQEDCMEGNCSQVVSYILAFDKNNKAKDVTQRYASGWLNTTPKIRVDHFCGPEWWQQTLEPYLMKGNKVKNENKQLEEKAMNLPLPKSIGEFKHHKLYALTRHLLKFEAIYPPDAPALGFIRGETIYARECVHTLYSRDHWVQQARTVKMGETPYKYVKARPGFKRRENDENRMLELFGLWQTEPYDPPAAENGVIPRNAYGNVELFKPEMLPKGTKYLTDMPGLSRIAKKLKLDCVAAMVGWDFRKGRNVPMLDGWIVCEEHVEILQAAFVEEQVNIQKREEEKRNKRIYGNWRKLIKGLFIKKKIEMRYGNKDEHP